MLLRPEIHHYEHNKVFVINDIELSIPPESIQIQKEDLQYQWKTLRSKVSTKIASGHGQNIVTVSVPFKYSQILELHRLILELRSSPFCNIENLFLRDTFVPRWSPSQKMAFSLIDFSLAPYPNSSDTFVVQMQFVWFNYFPFLHNWLYRREWKTEWIEQDNVRYKRTIGWNIDENADYAGSYFNITDFEENFVPNETPVDTESLPESKLFGTLFDLMPLPDKMEQSEPRGTAFESLIYKRYFNFIQRDALLRDFSIDVVGDLAGDKWSRLRDILFSIHRNSQNREFVHSLHEAIAISDYELTEEEIKFYTGLQTKWAEQIARYHNRIVFGFNIYKAVDIPSPLLDNYRNLASGESIEIENNSLQGGYFYNNSRTQKIPYRKVISNARGFHTPAVDQFGTPVPFDKIRITSPLRWRTSEELAKLYPGDSAKKERMHWGYDISKEAGNSGKEKFLSIKSGTITKIENTTTVDNGIWKQIDQFGRKGGVGAEYLSDLETSLIIALTNYSKKPFTNTDILSGSRFNNNGKYNSVVREFVKYGLVINSVSRERVFYVFDASSEAGTILEVKHDDGSFARYYHWRELEGFTAGVSTVQAGDVLGTVGFVSTINADTITSVRFSEREDKDEPFYETRSNVSEHLHIEYYEPIRENTQYNPKNEDNVQVLNSSYPGYILVDWLAHAKSRWGNLTQIPDSIEETIEQVSQLPERKEEEKEDKSAVEQAISTITELLENGWFYYSDVADVINVWYKPMFLEVNRNNTLPFLPEGLIGQDLIYSNFVGGFKNIISSIPILDHEFPTHQFLGSTEPFYIFEMYGKDNRIPADGWTFYLEGIGEGAASLEMVRQILLENAVNFRKIPDAGNVRIDTFITRLLGSVSDKQRKVNSNYGEVNEVVFNRRNSITRMDTSTVPDSPGLASIILEASETNSYDHEVITTESISKEELEAALTEVLNKLYRLEFEVDDKTKRILALLSIFENNISLLDESVVDVGFVQDDRVFIRGVDIDNATLDLLNSLVNREGYFQYSTLDRTADTSDPNFYAQVISDSNSNESQNSRNYLTVPVDDIFNIENGTAVLDLEALRIAMSDTDLYRQSPNAVDLAILYGGAVRRIVLSANLTLAEGKDLISGEIIGEPLSLNEVRSALYSLPVQPKFFRAIQQYMIDISARSYWPALDIISWMSPYSNSSSFNGSISQFSTEYKINKVTDELTSNSNWLTIASADKRDADLTYLPNLGYANNLFDEKNILNYGLYNLVEDITSPITDVVFSNLKSPFHILGELAEKSFFGYDDSNPARREVQNFYADQIQSASDAVYDKISRDYMLSLPTNSKTTADLFRAKAIELGTYTFGSGTGLLGLFSEDDQIFTSTTATIQEVFRSGGYIAAHPILPGASYYITPELEKEIDTLNRVELDPTFEEGTGFIGANTPIRGINQILNEITIKLGFYTRDEFLASAKIARSGSPFVWRVSRDNELKQLDVYKQALARIGQEVLKNPDLLRIFGLEHLEYNETANVKPGREAYPDLDLPGHPYYGDKYSTYPDFYMWNMYEDGNVFNEEIRAEIDKSVSATLINAFNSLGRLQSGDTFSRSDFGKIEHPGFNTAPLGPLTYQAEGSESGPAGHMATPFYPFENGELDKATQDWKVNVADLESTNRNLAYQMATGGQKTLGTVPELPPEVTDLNPRLPRLSNTEEADAKGAGLMYPARLNSQGYETLRNEYKKVTKGSMFGSRAGYLNQNERNIDEIDRIDGLPISTQIHPSHRFDVESLQLLAKSSMPDLFSQKRRLARAFPTFKLYFVEEDEQESRLLNFDDFYSYNGVKDFTIVLNRDTPADHAVITLQNISGTLDGTKRNAIADADYFYSPKMNRADQPADIGTSDEQGIDSLILRPGLNVQLRVGYSNNPDMLEVLISGRIVDIQWSQQGDTTQITVQSFGTELAQVLKNSAQRNKDIEPYYTTHQLLGSLMLEPELMHFGRWEFGKLFQINEGADSRLDFYDYNRNAHGGIFYFTGKISSFMISNSWLIALAAIGLTLADFAPISPTKAGRVATRGGKIAVEKATDNAGLIVLRKLRQITGGMVLNAGEKSPALRKLFNNLNLAGQESEIGFAARILKGLEERFSGTPWMENVARTGKKFIHLTDGTPSALSDDVVKELKLGVTEEAKQLAEGTAKRILAVIDATHGPGSKRAKELTDTVNARLARYIDRLNATDDIDEAANILALLQDELMFVKFKGSWFSNPVNVSLTNTLWKDIGGQPLRNVARTLSKTGLAGGAVTVSTLIPSIVGNYVFGGTDRGPLDAIANYFTANKVSLFLSPQDDNLYPPHPKDYMSLKKDSFTQTIVNAYTTFHDEWINPFDSGSLLDRWWRGVDIYKKQVSPKSCKYIVKNTFIWDVFKEMELRHPGWISACRPYGKEFRYTMFFGVPSQRYWAFGVSNKYVNRSNRLYRYLTNGITKDEYRSLYGSTVDKDQLIGDVDNLINETMTNLREGRETHLAKLGQTVLASRVLKEYLAGLNYRFIPFRRYHIMSSDTDIVYNGLITTSNASYNAVDMAYFDADSEGGPVGSILFKLHPFIPEHTLRVMPAQPYPNCRSVDMAVRYGMGELIRNTKQIYRGEIVLVGNGRIWPHDVGILIDNYNDMSGPLEVDQVVHNFSYETGWITEIKPAAFVVANETSSWPVLEALKMATLAIKNIEFDIAGINKDNYAVTALDQVVDSFNRKGDFDSKEDFLKRKIVEALGSDIASIDTEGNLSVISPLGEVSFDTGKSLVGTISDLSSIPGSYVDLGINGLGFFSNQPYLMVGTEYLKNRIFKNVPTAVDLIGGYSIFLQCLKGDAIQVVPIVKNGRPIIANMTVQDPSVIWKNFKGSLARVVDDYIDGTRDLLSLWNTYGTYIWRYKEFQQPDLNYLGTISNSNVYGNINLTGE